jgi:2-polyprenyl-3-methyl-5-hydroxy-6-metoxy-1,4-benzoquinol methylase
VLEGSALADVEDTCCPLCGADQARPWGAENGWTAVKCQPCGFVYVSPRPSAERIDAATALGLHPGQQSTLDVRGAFNHRKVAGLRVRLEQQYPGDELRRRPFRWLDVGAGFGELLLALRVLAPVGSTLVGVEACRPKVEAARRLGLELTAGSLADVDGPYDYISLVNVFSHLPDPQRFFRDMVTLLSPRGELLVVTGNAGDIPRSDYPQQLCLPEHLVFAGAAHLRTIFERAGCQIVSENAYRTSLPRPRIEQRAEAGLAWLLGRRVGYSGAFRSLWLRARRR